MGRSLARLLLPLVLVACGTESVDTDGDTDGGSTENRAPSKPVVRIEPPNPIQGQEIAVFWDDVTDPDGDQLAFDVTWSVDPPVADLDPKKRKIPAAQVKRGQTWNVRVAVTDGKRGARGDATVIIANLAPEITPVTITPQVPLTNDIVGVTTSVSDYENDRLSRTFTWKVNGEVVQEGGGAADTLDGLEHFDKGDTITVTLKVDDGFGGVTERTSDPVTVGNSAPTAVEVRVSPRVVTSANDLTCTVLGTSTDPDGDAVSFKYAWVEKGAPTASPASTSETLGSASTADGDVWACVVTPFDGTDGGPPSWDAARVGATPPQLSDLSLGTFYSCARRTDGYTACWGGNGGRRAEAPAGPFREIATGNDFGCGIDQDDGSLSCWGGQALITPPRVQPPAGAYTQVDAGSTHACALAEDGSLACWGSNGSGEATPPEGTDWASVEVGASFSCARSLIDQKLTCWGADALGQLVVPDAAFVDVSAYGEHACGIKDDYTLACWGNNPDGRATPPSGTFKSIAAGGDFTCGVASGGQLSCWGANTLGQTDAPPGSFLAVWAGFDHACAVDTSGGSVCWGNPSNDLLELPVGVYTDVAVEVRDFVDALGTVITEPFTCALDAGGVPLCFGLGSRYGAAPPTFGAFAQFDITSDHGCGVRTDGTLACWGNDRVGQATPPAGTFSKVDVGGTHSCGIQADGQVTCWGQVLGGAGLQPPAGSPRKDLAVGYDHSCVIEPDGSATCWGPPGLQISGVLNDPPGPFSQIASGDNHNCAVRNPERTVQCWGLVLVGAPQMATFTQVAIGSTASCGVKEDGGVACWGLGIGAVGLGRAPEGVTFENVSVTDQHACGLDTDGHLHCWGGVWRRPLDGDFPPEPPPDPVPAP
ncbi:MAG: hypothetical protein H6732_16435 [Alphaproteobacteria bacterium]|nr:hypothetical protein [Alphaproteobacteria bacterium]